MSDVIFPPQQTQDRWHVNRARLTEWCLWDGEAVIYDDLSGDTMKLDVIMTELFRRLLESDATSGDLMRHLAEVLDLAPDPKLWRLTEIALARFADSGLITPCQPPAPPGTSH